MKHGRIIDGKKEYGKRINCGRAPENQSSPTSTAHGITNLKFFTNWFGTAGPEGGYWPEKIGGAGDRISMSIDGDNITIKTIYDTYYNANYICIVELHYIKN